MSLTSAAARLLALAAALGGSAWMIEGCTSILGDFATGKDASVESGPAAEAGGGGDSGPVEDGGSDGGEDAQQGEAGLALGASCEDAGTPCASGFCVDGVCCDSACSGVCEACNLSGSVGTCSPIPANTDPDLECVMVVPEAGTVDAAPEAGPAAEAGATDSGSSDSGGNDAAASPDAGPADAGGGISDASNDVGFNVPDGGVTLDTAACAGSCNGARACQYPGHATTCGTAFCNTPAQTGGFVCDGTGNCALSLANCTNYACTGSACGTSCSAPSDCLPTAFCNNSGVCQPTLGNGVGCSLDNQCTSGFCVSDVCCSSACNIPGGTCTSADAVGTCKCSVSCADGGSCQLFYRDSDSDGYGDDTGTTSNGNAVVGCSGSPPTGFVADNTDCDDHDPNAHPGQTAYFTTPSLGTHTFDYNCDGILEYQTPMYPGGSCEFCSGTAPSCTDAYTCAAASDSSGFGCQTDYRFLCLLRGACEILSYCGYSATAGFTENVACGVTATETTCGECSAAGDSASTTTSSVTQACH